VVSLKLLEDVSRRAREHCAARGYVSGPNWNPLEPHDPVAAFAVARLLVGSGRFDCFVAVAPEGHVYGFFFEELGVPVHEVFVDYPPRAVTAAGWLSAVVGKRVLVIEDDVVSGVSLGLVVAAVLAHRPLSVSVYLGRRADGQCPENMPEGVGLALLAETLLASVDRPQHEAEFIRHFGIGHAEPFSWPTDLSENENP
jgi:hypothetical protein